MLTEEGQKDEMQQQFWQTGAHQETFPGPESMELLQLLTCCTTTMHIKCTMYIMSAYHMHPCNTGHTKFGSWNSPQFVKLPNASSTYVHTHPQLPPQSSGYGNLVYLCLQILHEVAEPAVQTRIDLSGSQSLARYEGDTKSCEHSTYSNQCVQRHKELSQLSTRCC